MKKLLVLCILTSLTLFSSGVAFADDNGVSNFGACVSIFICNGNDDKHAIGIVYDTTKTSELETCGSIAWLNKNGHLYSNCSSDYKMQCSLAANTDICGVNTSSTTACRVDWKSHHCHTKE
jgi:hypothetical protein